MCGTLVSIPARLYETCNHQSTAVRAKVKPIPTATLILATSAKSLNGNFNLQPVLACLQTPPPGLIQFFLRGGGGSVHRLSQCWRLKTGKINIAELGKKCNVDQCSALSEIKLLPWLPLLAVVAKAFQPLFYAVKKKHTIFCHTILNILFSVLRFGRLFYQVRWLF